MSIAVERTDPTKLRSRRMRGALVGSGVFLGVYAAVVTGAFPTAVICVALAMLVSMLPVHPTLARRWAYIGAIVMGWAPLTWLLPLPSGLERGTLLVAMGSAWLAMTIAGSSRPISRMRDVRPALSLTDLWALVAGGAAFVVMQGWVGASRPADALAAMMSGYDNAAHFDMFSMLRQHGKVMNSLGPSPDGSAWMYDSYPQGFHVLAAMFAELVDPRVSTGSADLVAYVHAVAAVVVVGTTILIAAVCSLAPLRRRPLVTLPVTSLICTAYLWGPGPKMLANGFVNFWLAAVATSCAIVFAMDLRRRPSVVGVAATGGALLCVVNCWAPLVILATPVCLILCQVSADAFRSPSRRRDSRLFVAILLAAALCALKTLTSLVSSVSLRTVVTARGGLNWASIVPTLVLLGACLLVCLAGPGVVRRLPSRRGVAPDLWIDRLRLWGLTPLLGVALLSVLLVWQFRTLGTSSYYFLKYLIGFELVLTSLTAAVLALLLISLVRLPGGRTGVAISCVAAVAATQFFGLVPWRDAPLRGGPATEDGADLSTMSRPGSPTDILAASGSTGPDTALDQVYFIVGEQRGPSGLLPAIWFQAITSSLTETTAARLGPLDRGFRDRDDAVTVLTDLLTASPEVSALVSPQFVEPLRGALPPPLRPRVTSWKPAPSSSAP